MHLFLHLLTFGSKQINSWRPELSCPRWSNLVPYPLDMFDAWCRQQRFCKYSIFQLKQVQPIIMDTVGINICKQTVAAKTVQVFQEFDKSQQPLSAWKMQETSPTWVEIGSFHRVCAIKQNGYLTRSNNHVVLEVCMQCLLASAVAHMFFREAAQFGDGCSHSSVWSTSRIAMPPKLLHWNKAA